MKAILAVAEKELKDGLRNRWLLAITLLFAIMGMGLSWFGAVSVGSLGFSSTANTVISLSNLSIFLLPLIALLLAYQTIVGEDEDGTLMLLLTYPLSKAELIIGKLIGHTSILAIAIFIGFGSSVLSIIIFAENIDIGEVLNAFALFIFSSILLGMVFLSLSYVISSWVIEKSKAAGLALSLWFFFVLIFDMSLLGILVITEGQIQPELFPYLLLLNPTDIFRLINLATFDGNGTGLLSIASDQSFNMFSLVTSLLAWILLPLYLAYRRLLQRPI